MALIHELLWQNVLNLGMLLKNNNDLTWCPFLNIRTQMESPGLLVLDAFKCYCCDLPVFVPSYVILNRQLDTVLTGSCISCS